MLNGSKMRIPTVLSQLPLSNYPSKVYKEVSPMVEGYLPWAFDRNKWCFSVLVVESAKNMVWFPSSCRLAPRRLMKILKWRFWMSSLINTLWVLLWKQIDRLWAGLPESVTNLFELYRCMPVKGKGRVSRRSLVLILYTKVFSISPRYAIIHRWKRNFPDCLFESNQQRQVKISI